MPHPQYRNAPIVESLIDIRIKPGASLNLEALRAVGDPVSSSYPDVKRIREVRGEFSASEQLDISSSQRDKGYAFASQDGKRVFQARLDGFTFNRLAPYENWDEFRGSARACWTVFRPVAKPLAIERLAVRFINKIELPDQADDAGSYLQFGVLIPEGIEGTPEDFLARVRLSQAGDLTQTVVTVNRLARPGLRQFVTLDIEVFLESPRGDDDGSIWSTIDSFRKRKNVVFESSLTDAARALFD